MAGELYSHNQSAYLNLTIDFLDEELARLKADGLPSVELAFERTLVSEITSDLVLGGTERYGGMLPLVRKFSPQIRDYHHEERSIIGQQSALNEIVAQDGYMLPSGVFIPVGDPLHYVRQVQDVRQPTVSAHTSLILHRQGTASTEAIRSEVSINRSNTSLFTLVGHDRDARLNLTDILIDG
jgi:hypothetical protein